MVRGFIGLPGPAQRLHHFHIEFTLDFPYREKSKGYSNCQEHLILGFFRPSRGDLSAALKLSKPTFNLVETFLQSLHLSFEKSYFILLGEG